MIVRNTMLPLDPAGTPCFRGTQSLDQSVGPPTRPGPGGRGAPRGAPCVRRTCVRSWVGTFARLELLVRSPSAEESERRRVLGSFPGNFLIACVKVTGSILFGPLFLFFLKQCGNIAGTVWEQCGTVWTHCETVWRHCETVSNSVGTFSEHSREPHFFLIFFFLIAFRFHFGFILLPGGSITENPRGAALGLI